MKALRFDCDGCGLSFWFSEDEIELMNNDTWKIKIKKEDIDNIVSKFESLKYIIELGEKNEN